MAKMLTDAFRFASRLSAFPGVQFLAAAGALCIIAALFPVSDALGAEPAPGYMKGNAALLALNSLVSIKSEKNGKAPYFIFKGEGPWRLYVAEDAQGFDFSSPVLSAEGPGAFPLPVRAGKHNFYAVESSGQVLIFSESRLPVSGGYNFRDLGGIATLDGRITAWGKLFRADALSGLTPEDLAYLESIPLHTVIDFRTDEGVERSPNRLPATVRQYVRLPLRPGSLGPGSPDLPDDSLVWEEFMRNMNRDLVQNPENIQVYRAFFARIQQKEELPLLFHCAAGKDRTGLAAAYVLFSLGVSREEVMNNYLASAVYLEGKYDRLIARDPSREPLFTVKAEYLQAAIEAMEKKSGSVEKYLTRELGVDIDRMRELFLQ